MKKIATITFHSCYNFGSALQAYALQEFVKKISKKEINYNIINLRTPIQKEMYKNIYEKKGIKNIAKKIMLLPYKKKIKEKDEKFEYFLKEKLNLTKEYQSLEQLNKENLKYDYYISGSDQLWNLRARDFDWANYLEFVKSGKKISYAASFGPKKQTWNKEQMERVKKDLLDYDFISVREQGSYENVNKLTGLNAEINVDPTMLISIEEWNKLIKDIKPLNKKYILLYDLGNENAVIPLAKTVSKKLKMPVVIAKYMGLKTHLTCFDKEYDAGPLEFLSLIKNASLILSSSFHGTVFSIIFNRPFYAINGAKDYRIKTLLEKMKLGERTIENINIDEKCSKAFDIDFQEANKMLKKEQEKSEKYLKKALDIE